MEKSPAVREIYRRDTGEIPRILEQTLLKKAIPDFVVQPGRIEEAAEVVRWAKSEGIPITPRGAGTFGMGGAIPLHGGILLDLSPRMEMQLDTKNAEVLVSPGVRWNQLFRRLEGTGFSPYIHITNYYSTIAGAVATGNLGAGSTMYGSIQNFVESLRVILPDGEIQEYASSHPHFSYYFGSEGQFGIIWDVKMRLMPAVPEFFPILISSLEPERLFTFAEKLLQEFPVYHLKYFNGERMREMNILWGKSLYLENPALLATVWNSDAGKSLKRMAEGEGLGVAPRFLAYAVWSERLFSLRMKQLGPGLLASELVMPSELAFAWLEKVERRGKKWGMPLSVEGHFLKGKEILLILSAPVKRTNLLSAHLSLALLRSGIRSGGRPYGIGIWNTPYARWKFGRDFILWKKFKEKVDPNFLWNRGKFFALPRGIFWRGYQHLGGPVADLVSAVFALLPHSTRKLEEWKRGQLHDAANFCSRCGSCIPVCPAYLYTKDERTTARGKLLFYLALKSGESFSFEEVQPFLWCMHCHACTDVCQSELDLLPVWEQFEEMIGKKWGKDEKKIREFIQGVEKSGVMEQHPYGALLRK